MTRWGPDDDTRLLQFIKNNQIDPSDLSKEGIEKVRAEFYPERPYKGFSTLFRKKIRKWNIEQTLAGRRKGQLVLVVGSAPS